MSKPQVGMRAEQVISGSTSSVRRRCWGSRTMRVAAMAGTAHAWAVSRGIERLAAQLRHAERAIHQEAALRAR